MSFAFKYLRADRQESVMGGFSTKEKAEQGRKAMADAGASCSPVYPVEEKQTEKTGNETYFEGKISRFKNYLNLELEILDHEGVNYEIVYDYLKEFPRRILRFVRGNTPYIPKENSGPLDEADRKEYLARIAMVLEDKSRDFSPMDGSVPEDIGRNLKSLSGLVANL